jgi:hypothetical protein
MHEPLLIFVNLFVELTPLDRWKFISIAALAQD